MYPFLVLREGVQQRLEALPADTRRQLCGAIGMLTIDPRPQESAPLAGYSTAFRLRLGTWRILYEINEQIRSISIARLEERGPDTYRAIEQDFGPQRSRT